MEKYFVIVTKKNMGHYVFTDKNWIRQVNVGIWADTPSAAKRKVKNILSRSNYSFSVYKKPHSNNIINFGTVMEENRLREWERLK